MPVVETKKRDPAEVGLYEKDGKQQWCDNRAQAEAFRGMGWEFKTAEKPVAKSGGKTQKPADQPNE